MSAAALGLVLVADSNAQAPAATPAAAPKLEFEVASVRENQSGDKPSSNFPLNAGPQFTEAGDLLTARSTLLLQFIVFAYKPTSYQLQVLRAGLPEWTRTAHFDIEAHAEGKPTKDQMRLMMQSLLESRFGLKVHHESREVPVFALTLVHPGRTGPALKPHPPDDPDCTRTSLPKAIGGGYPPACGAGASTVPSAPGLLAIAGRKIPIEFIAISLTNLGNGIDRPVLNRTGLEGTYDFTLEWVPEPERFTSADAPAPDTPAGPSFFEALKDQLGLKLLPDKGPVDVLVLDHIEHPSAN